MKLNTSLLSKAAATATASLLPMFAHAEPFVIPTEVTDAKAAVLVIGLAVFGIAVGVKLYKWLKTAL